MTPRRLTLRRESRAGSARAGGQYGPRTHIGRAWRSRDRRDGTNGTRGAIFTYNIAPSQVASPFSATQEATRNSGVHSGVYARRSTRWRGKSYTIPQPHTRRHFAPPHAPPSAPPCGAPDQHGHERATRDLTVLMGRVGRSRVGHAKPDATWVEGEAHKKYRATILFTVSSGSTRAPFEPCAHTTCKPAPNGVLRGSSSTFSM